MNDSADHSRPEEEEQNMEEYMKDILFKIREKGRRLKLTHQKNVLYEALGTGHKRSSVYVCVLRGGTTSSTSSLSELPPKENAVVAAVKKMPKLKESETMK